MDLFQRARSRSGAAQPRFAPGHTGDPAWLRNTIQTATRKRDMLRPFLKEFCDFMFRRDVFYVADSGTLLGAVRDGREILWDDDYDLFVLDEDLVVLATALEEKPLFSRDGKKYSFGIRENQDGYLSVQAECEDKSFPPVVFADLFFQSDRSNWIHPRAEDMFPINRIEFEGMTLNVMDRPEAYFNALYGSEWSDEYVITNHSLNMGNFSKLTKHRFPKITKKAYKNLCREFDAHRSKAKMERPPRVVQSVVQSPLSAGVG